VDALNNLGALSYEEGNLEDAIALFRHAVKLHPENMLSQFNLGSALEETGHDDQARRHLRRAVQLDPENADAQYKIDKDACSTLSGNAKDICVAEAKGKDNVAKADADAAYENTPKAREHARVAHAQANYDVAIDPDLWNYHLDFVWHGVTSAWNWPRDGARVNVGVNANRYARDHYVFVRPDLSDNVYFNTGHKGDVSGFAKSVG